MKQTKISNVIDYLNEKAYVYDIEISDDDYELFFGKIYDCFCSVGKEATFYNNMVHFLSTFIFLLDKINVSTLCDLFTTEIAKNQVEDFIDMEKIKKELFPIKTKIFKNKVFNNN